MPNHAMLRLWDTAERQLSAEGALATLSPGRRVIAIGNRLTQIWADLQRPLPLPLPR